ncbi:3230_t:CDS:2 [Paraglomus brasilianum]|uniref:3230_t:CDS:1 n=1 Tax=Paraglomus brasilianum TaxID=144538 RepID=A0A9N9BW54_9GLOM|nr:3230_t:CDS:2 [Paraglomus brasilianum]
MADNFGPQIGTSADSYFQSDRDVAIQQSRAAKSGNNFGEPIKCSSKVLCMLLLTTPDVYAYVGESGFLARKINLATGKTVKFFKGHTGPVTCIGVWFYNGNEYLITGSWDKTLRKWDTKTKETVNTFSAHTDFVKSMAIARNEPILYSGSSDKKIRSWNLVTGEELRSFQGHTRGIEDLGLDESEQYLYSASSDKDIRKWNTSTGDCLQVFDGHLTSVYCLRLFDEEMWTASADKTVKRWDLVTGKPDTSLDHPDFVKCLVVVEPYVITGGRDEDIRIFEIASGKLVKKIEGHFDEVSCMAVHGTTLYTGSLDCTVRKWSIAAKDIQPSTEAKVTKTVETKPTTSIMTAEEEKELADLLGSDEE